jgi:hypothetical protein
MEKDIPSTLRSSAGTVIDGAIGENDVLLGRGTGPNENIGNIRFRVASKKEFTLSYNNGTIDSSCKSKVARRVVEAIKSRNGRFLRKLTKDEAKQAVGGLKTGTSHDLFVVVSDKLAIDKARHSIRFQLKKQGNRSSTPPTSVGQVYNHHYGRNPNTTDSLMQAKSLDEIRDLERLRIVNAILSKPNPNELFFPRAIGRGGNTAHAALLLQRIIVAMALGALATQPAEAVSSRNTISDRTMP